MIKSVLVTSPGSGEGKSTSVANLAIAFAQMGMRTLLIDTDLRRPVLHELFQIPRDVGLTSVLVGKMPLKDAVKKTKVKNLYLLTSGKLPKNPSEFLASKVMSRLIQRLRMKFDIVLFDSPPVIAVTDATLLSTKIDGVVLVARSGQTNRDALVRSRTLLEKVDAHLFGVLLNGLSTDHRYGYYYEYYGYGYS